MKEFLMVGTFNYGAIEIVVTEDTPGSRLYEITDAVTDRVVKFSLSVRDTLEDFHEAKDRALLALNTCRASK